MAIQFQQGRRDITLDTAMRSSRFFGTSVEFWLNLQDNYDLEEIKRSGMSRDDAIQRSTRRLPRETQMSRTSRVSECGTDYLSTE